MIYLSKTVFKSHGRLKPSNCVIDNKWTLKITGQLVLHLLYVSVYVMCIVYAALRLWTESI